MNTLPNDIARCDGYYAEGWREGCETCLRRTAPRSEDCQMVAPPPIIAFECEFLIEPPMQAKLVIDPATMDEVQRFYSEHNHQNHERKRTH
jgi:hypothetical protein